MTLVYSDALTPGDDLGGLAAGRLATTTINGREFILLSADTAYGRVKGFAVAELLPNGALDLIETTGGTGDPLSGRVFEAQGMDVLEKGGKSYFYLQGSATPGGDAINGQGISVLEMDANGGLREIQRLALDGAFSSTVSQNGIDPSVVTSRGKDFLIQQNHYDDTLMSFRIRDNGTLAQKDTAPGTNYVGNAMDTITKGKLGYIVSHGPYQSAPIEVHKVSGRGNIDKVFGLDPDEPLLFNRVIVDIKMETIGKKTFAFVAESTNGTILVYEMAKSGALTLVAQEQAGVSDRWGFPYSLETFETGGQTYLVGGGNDANLVVFAVSRNGALTEVDEFEFESNALRNVNELAVSEVNGRDFVVASVPIDSSLRSWRFDETDTPDTGSDGRDRIVGTEEDDRIFGRKGGDRLFGEDGDDLIEGGGGRDRIFGGEGRDDLYGDRGGDRIDGGEGNNWLFGGAGRDKIFSGAGTDYAVGGAGNDRIETGAGNDRLFGDGGDDELFGGTGNDRLSDGAGSDRLAGGDNNDTFIFANDGEIDYILDFEDGKDKIDLRAEGSTLIFPDITVSQSGSDVRLDYAGESIVITSATGSISVSDIGLDDFILA